MQVQRLRSHLLHLFPDFEASRGPVAHPILLSDEPRYPSTLNNGGILLRPGSGAPLGASTPYIPFLERNVNLPNLWGLAVNIHAQYRPRSAYQGPAPRLVELRVDYSPNRKRAPPSCWQFTGPIPPHFIDPEKGFMRRVSLPTVNCKVAIV